MTDEEQGAEDAQEEGDEQDMAESPVIGLDYGGCLGASQRPTKPQP